MTIVLLLMWSQGTVDRLDYNRPYWNDCVMNTTRDVVFSKQLALCQEYRDLLFDHTHSNGQVIKIIKEPLLALVGTAVSFEFSYQPESYAASRSTVSFWTIVCLVFRHPTLQLVTTWTCMIAIWTI